MTNRFSSGIDLTFIFNTCFREWLQILSRDIFNSKFGLFIEGDNGCYIPNPDSAKNAKHLAMFKFS